MPFQTVSRQKSKLRMALTGVSGSGKTLGALYIAYGITGDWGKIALIDTEHERARFYANRQDLGTGAYLYQSMAAPFSPQRYKHMVAEGAQAVGPDGVVIVDSMTHAWNAEGGVLDIKDRISSRAGQNSYIAWNEAGKEQSALVNTILAVNAHTICTMRSKMAYELQEDEKGKKKPVKMGLAPVQRDDTEYEFDIVLDIGRDHIAVASKDTTFLDKYGAVITPDLGKQLAAWLDEGVEPKKEEQKTEPAKPKTQRKAPEPEPEPEQQESPETPNAKRQMRTKEYLGLGEEYNITTAQLKTVYKMLVEEGYLSETNLMLMEDREFEESMMVIESRLQELGFKAAS